MLKVFTTFSGYDSQCLALRKADIEFDLIGWSEIDKFAIKAHNILFPEYAERNYGDISKIDWSKVPDIDPFTYSSPCQDFSIAGNMKGGTEGSGTRSSLLWECRKAILAKKPKMLVFENVKNLVCGKFKELFNEWERELASYGYNNYWKVLNATEFNVPQNRERVFLVSILDDRFFEFPAPVECTRRIKDILEDEYDEKYIVKPEQLKSILAHCDRKVAEGCGFKASLRGGQTYVPQYQRDTEQDKRTH